MKMAPLVVERVVPLALEPARDLVDQVIGGLGSVLAKLPGVIIGPWVQEARQLNAGRMLTARLALDPVGEQGTRVRIEATGVTVMLDRIAIRDAVVNAIDRAIGT